MRLWALTLLMLIAQPLSAGDINHITVQHSHGLYTLDLDVLIDAEQPVIWLIATDYKNIDRLSDLIVKSEIIDHDNNLLKRRLFIESCILFYCIEAIMVEDIMEIDKTLILATIDVFQSDFDFGITEWHIRPEERVKTRILFHNKIKPSFWIPPLIGPLLIKRKLLKETKEIITRIELLAANG